MGIPVLASSVHVAMETMKVVVMTYELVTEEEMTGVMESVPTKERSEVAHMNVGGTDQQVMTKVIPITPWVGMSEENLLCSSPEVIQRRWTVQGMEMGREPVIRQSVPASRPP